MIVKQAAAPFQTRVDGTPSVALSFGLEPPAGWTDRTTPEMLGVAGAVLNTLRHAVAAEPGISQTPLSLAWQAPGAERKARK